MNPRPNSQRWYWACQLTGWGFYSLSRYVGGLLVMHLPWLRFGVELLTIDALAFGVSHLLRDHVRRHRWNTFQLRERIPRIIAAGFICGTPIAVLAQFTDVALLNDPDQVLQGVSSPLRVQLALPIALADQIVNWSAVFIVWQVLYFAAIALREYRSAQLKQSELTRALQLAELRLLKSQLNPHFLFNALNTVRSLIADNPSRAQSAVTRLASTLRYSLSSRQQELVTLSQELDIVADYLELESMRFEDRLRLEQQVPKEAGEVKIPVMLLQTLVENAIKHGIAQLPGGGLLRISAQLENDRLVLQVENPRPTAPATATVAALSHEGVGLHNARDRLRLLFGARASLELDLSQPGMATARLSIPSLA